jgi:hypothetical protein
MAAAFLPAALRFRVIAAFFAEDLAIAAEV